MTTRRSTQLGDIDVAYEVLGKIATYEASRVEGVVGFAPAKGESRFKKLISRRARYAARKGVVVEEDESGRIHLDLFVIAQYNVNLQELARSVQQAVMEGLHKMTEADVADINVHISGLAIPEGEADPKENNLNTFGEVEEK